MTNSDCMLIAYHARTKSNCARRQIGVIYRIGPGTVFFQGSNSAALPCEDCSRRTGDCAATHAEVDALLNARGMADFPRAQLYIWAEVPCKACISMIHKLSVGNCIAIHCLSQESYGEEYPNVLNYTEQIKQRVKYAEQLAIEVITYNRSDLLSLIGG